MPNAITAIFGADSRQMVSEMRKLESIAGVSGARMGAHFATGFGHGGPGGGISGIMRESLVIIRELGRGNFNRIPGSATLLFQYLGGLGYILKSSAAEAVKAAEADGVLAEKMAVTAVVARDKALASKAAVVASTLDGGASLRLALADNVAANAAKKAALAQEEKAVASDRAARVALASATTSIGPLGVALLGLAAVIALVYGAYKIFTAIVKMHTDSQIKAQEAAYKLRLSYQDEADALKKLETAAQRTEEALRKLNETHNDSVKYSNLVIDAMRAEFEAHKTLSDAKKQGQLIDIQIAEKTGAISHNTAAKKRAEIEKQSVEEAAKAKLDELQKESDFRDRQYYAAKKQNDLDQQSAQAASDRLNKSPEAKENAKELTRLEKIQKSLLSDADEYEKKAASAKPGSSEQQVDMAMAKVKNRLAEIAQQEVEDQKAKMKPDEIAAAETLRRAEESAQALKSASESSAQAATAVNEFSKNSPALVAQQEANIDKEAKLNMAMSEHGGFYLSSQQRLGAYAATPPDWSVLMVNVKAIAQHTSHLKPDNNRPPGARPPQYGGRQNR